MPKVTEKLRYTWEMQRRQMVEERTEDQSGNPRSLEDIAIQDFDIRMMDVLLNLPLGTKFDAREIEKDLIASLDTSVSGR